MSEARPGWSLSHIIAACHVCSWAREQHQHERDGGASILSAARRHAARTGHYVGVERGQVTGYGPWPVADAVAPVAENLR